MLATKSDHAGPSRISLPALVRKARSLKIARAFTWTTRALLALAFLPSGVTKLLGNRFTVLGVDTSVGFFFEALYQTGWYWRFIGVSQLLAALLLVIPRTTTLGALVYFPLALNIFAITVSMHFRGTPFITGLMLLGSIYLLLWDFERLTPLIAKPAPGRDEEGARPRSGG